MFWVTGGGAVNLGGTAYLEKALALSAQNNQVDQIVCY